MTNWTTVNLGEMPLAFGDVGEGLLVWIMLSEEGVENAHSVPTSVQS